MGQVTKPIRVSPDEPSPTHHVRLKGGGKDIGLILVDPSGRKDGKAIGRDRLVTTSLKISQGNPQYSDFELPFTPIVQDDWSGGRAQEQFEEDVTRFLDSWNCQSDIQGKVFLGPEMQLTSGYRDMDYYLAGSKDWQRMLPGNRRYLGFEYTHSGDPLGFVKLYAKRKGTPTDALRLGICMDDGGLPGQELDTRDLQPAGVADILGKLINWNININVGLSGQAENKIVNPRFENNVTDGWTLQSGGSANHDAAIRYYGSGSCRITAGVSVSTCMQSDSFTIADGEALYASVIGKAAAGDKLTLMGRDTTHGSTEFLNYGTTAYNGEWQLIEAAWTNNTGVPVSFYIRLYNRYGDSASDVWYDCALAAVGAPSGSSHFPYFDGSIGQGYAWTGTADNSTSTMEGWAGWPAMDGHTYHFTVRAVGAANDDIDNHWLVGIDADGLKGHTAESSDGSSWSASNVDLYYWVSDLDLNYYAWLYKYKEVMYYASMLYYDGAPEIWMNGDRGVADSNAGQSSKLIDASKSWAVDQWKGCVVKIIGGTGSLDDEDPPWRKIVSNDATRLIVSPAWLVEQDTTTEYVILGSDTWQQISGHGIANKIRDRVEIDGIQYFALGDNANIRRGREYNNAGAWTREWVDDGTNKAARMEVVHHSLSSLGRQIWRVLNDTVEVSRSDVKAWGANLVFSSGEVVGDALDKAQQLVQYVDPSSGEKILWVIKKGSAWAIKTDGTNDIPDMIQLPEMASVASDDTGTAALVHNLYLYWSMFKGGLERFYNDVVDDVGPNRDRGFEFSRRGIIRDMVGYPGAFFAAFDAGATGYSAILKNNGDGWHEYYRSDQAGQRIRSVHIQVIPGDTPDRLWFSENNNLMWVPLPSGTVDPTKDPNFPYTHESYVTSSRMHAGMQDVQKLYDELKIMAENLGADCWIEVDYKVDDENSEWQTIPNSYTESPSQAESLVEFGEDGVAGKWLIARIRLLTKDRYQTPELRTALMNSISKITTKFGFALNVLFETKPKDLNGEPDDYYEDGLQKIDDLDELADAVQVLEMSSNYSLFDGMRVTVDAPALKPLFQSAAEGIEGYIGTLPVTQVYKQPESSG